MKKRWSSRAEGAEVGSDWRSFFDILCRHSRYRANGTRKRGDTKGEHKNGMEQGRAEKKMSWPIKFGGAAVKALARARPRQKPGLARLSLPCRGRQDNTLFGQFLCMAVWCECGRNYVQTIIVAAHGRAVGVGKRCKREILCERSGTYWNARLVLRLLMVHIATSWESQRGGLVTAG